MLDMKTTIFSFLITNALITWFIAVLWYQNRKRYAGLGLWLIDFLLQGVGFLLLLLRDIAPDLVSIVIAQTLIQIGVLCILIGLERFVGKPSSHIHNYMILGGFVGLMVYFTFVQPDIDLRTILICAVTILLTGQISWLLLRRVAPALRLITLAVGVVALLYALAALVRIGELILLPVPAASGLFELPSVQVAFVFINQVLGIALTFTLIMMVMRRLELDVQTQADERRRAEQGLAESQKRFALAFHSSPYAVTITRASDGQIIEANQGFANIAGYSAAECIGKTSLALNLWMDEQDRAGVMAELAKGNPVSGMEFRFRKKDGTIITGLFSANAFTMGDQPCILSSINDITERKQAEEKLRKSEASFQAVLQSTADGVLAVGSENQVQYANERFAEMWRIPQEVLNSQDDSVLLQHVLGQLVDPPSFLQKVQELYQSAEESFDTLYFKDGRVFERLSRPLMQKGEPRGRVWSFRDISARQRAEQERHALLEIMQGLTVTKGLAEFLELIHRSIARVIYAENFFVVFYHPSTGLFEMLYVVDKYDLPAPPAKLDRGLTAYVFRTAAPLLLTQETFEELRARGDVELVGTPPACWLGAPLKAAGETIGVIAVQNYQDTLCYSERDKEFLASIGTQVALAIERKQAESELRRLRMAMDDSSEAMFLTDLKGTITFINPAFTHLYGYSVEEVVGKVTPRILKSGKMTAENYQFFWQTLLSKQVVKGEMFNKTKDGRYITVEGSANPIADEQGNIVGFLGIQHDITDRKQMEEKLKEASIHDALTGLYNRGFFDEEMIRLERGRQFPVSIVMGDLDDLKETNDRDGHAAGDALLVRAVQVLNAAFRAEDVIARIGGDEFAILLPNTDTASAQQLLKRVRRALAEHNAAHGGVPLSISFGVSTAEQGVAMIDTLKEADARMYREKHNS